MFRTALGIILSIFMGLAHAEDSLSPLPADKAFAFSAFLNQDNQLILEWNIAPGYYLYRNQLSFIPAPTSHVQIGKIEWPVGQTKQDSIHGVYQAYIGSIKVPVQLNKPSKGILNLNVHYQGCSSAGFCYTPIKKAITVDLSRIRAPENLSPYVQSVGATIASPKPNEDAISKFFNERNIGLIILSFLGLGLLLAFTPCVLPMVPILSGIIVGHGKKTSGKKAFLLSLAYVGGMAVTYAIIGVVIALIGSRIQAELQRPWIIVLFSGLFVLLALALFGFYELQLPRKWQQQVAKLSNRQKGGTYIGVFLMGSLSTLIVSPCVSAPLVGVLAYIGQTGDVWLGAMALLALGIGMGIPLLLIGISANQLLPKAGPWMTMIERLFGIMMLGVAIWMISRMIPGPVTLFLWAILCVFAAIFLGVFSNVPRQWQWLVRIVAVLVMIYGTILIIGAVFGNSDPFAPWEQLNQVVLHQQNNRKKLPFKIIHSMKELDKTLLAAKKAHTPVMLDFYADWCSACVVMDRKVFSKPAVQTALQSFILLRSDLTQNNAFDQALLKRFNVIGPPTIIFFTSKGRELTSQRIVGEVNRQEFLTALTKIQEAN